MNWTGSSPFSKSTNNSYGSQVLKNMNRRYVVLSAGTLAWYTSSDATPSSLKGTVALAGAAATPLDTGSSQRCGFTVTTSANDAELYFEAETQAESVEWIRALSASP